MVLRLSGEALAPYFRQQSFRPVFNLTAAFLRQVAHLLIQ
jgi:hypothetical protein